MATLLVIDEDRDVLETYESMVKSRGRVGIFTAPTLDHARQILNSERVGIVLLDLELKNADTDQFLDELSRQWPRALPLVITANPTPERCRELEGRGVARIFKKPCSIVYLYEELEGAGFFDGKVPRRSHGQSSPSAETSTAQAIEADEVPQQVISTRTTAGLVAAVLVLVAFVLYFFFSAR